MENPDISSILTFLHKLNDEVYELRLKAKQAFDSVNIYLAFALKLDLHPMLALCLRRRAKECRQEFMMTENMRIKIEQDFAKADMYNLFEEQEKCLELLTNVKILLRWEERYYLTCINKFQQVAKDVKEERFKTRSHLLTLLK